MHERMATGEVEQDARAGIGTMDARQAWGALIAHATMWKEWSDGSDERYEEALVAVYLTAGRGLIPRRGDWLPGTAWDMSDLAPLSVAERCEPAPEDARSRTFVGNPFFFRLRLIASVLHDLAGILWLNLRGSAVW